MQTFIAALLVILFIFAGFEALAAERKLATATPISLGLVPPAQFPPKHFTVNGLRISGIYGISRKVRGIDIGLLGNSTDEHFAGIAVAGIMNLNHGTSKVIGLQLAGVTNMNKGAGEVYGFQVSLANIAKYTDIYGVQIGLYNRARNVRGLQIGLFNHCLNLVGVQIGLANFNEGGPFVVSPLINAAF